MLQPDAVYVLKANEPGFSVNFFNQQLQVGLKNGSIKVFCLSVSFFRSVPLLLLLLCFGSFLRCYLSKWPISFVLLLFLILVTSFQL